MKVKDLINALERLDENMEIGVIHTNYGNEMEYEIKDNGLLTNDNVAMLVISPSTQVGYYDTDRTDSTFSIVW